MRHGSAVGQEPTAAELGEGLAVQTGGRRQKAEELGVATGPSDVRVTYSFRLDNDRRECVLKFTCRFPADEQSHGADWAKAAYAEAALWEVLSGEDPFSLLPDDLQEFILRGGDDEAEDG